MNTNDENKTGGPFQYLKNSRGLTAGSASSIADRIGQRADPLDLTGDSITGVQDPWVYRWK